MLIPYTAQGRGYTKMDWLESYHAFSFGDFHDADRMGVSVLRVLNDDVVQPGAGFGAHPHRDMEILTYMVDGTIEHEDSLGHKQRIGVGELQRMTAGTGIVHSEYNPSATEALRLIQIWIHPDRRGLEPSYEQAPVAVRPGLVWLASGDGTPGTLHLHQDARLGRLSGTEPIALPLAERRIGFVYVIKGSAVIAGHTLRSGDGLAIGDEADLQAVMGEGAEALWLDLPGYRAS